MSAIQDHPLRYALANELHARPFPSLTAPGHVAYIALKPPVRAAHRDRDADLAHLVALLDRHGARHPQPGATHYAGRIGRYWLKWESHTEFVTYTVFGEGSEARAFDPAGFEILPADWLATASGVRMTSILIRIEEGTEPEVTADKLGTWFEQESLAAASVLDGRAVIASDFRIDAASHMRFAVFAEPGTGARRIGRVVQRICEIETYKTMSMLGFARSKDISGSLGPLATRLSEVVASMNSAAAASEMVLHELLNISAELEQLEAQSSFRFGATAAYEAIVHQRIEALREARFGGRQTFAEFMTRRFDPAMRTVKSTEARLRAVSARALRAGELLRTQVDVARSAQNQALLESMDRRAALQLRLQQTVEGLSVVAVSYYAVNLASYLVDPLLEPAGISPNLALAGLTLPVVAVVWWMVRRIRRGIGH